MSWLRARKWKRFSGSDLGRTNIFKEAGGMVSSHDYLRGLLNAMVDELPAPKEKSLTGKSVFERGNHSE